MSSHSHGREPSDHQFSIFEEAAADGPSEPQDEGPEATPADEAAHRYLRGFTAFSTAIRLRYAADDEDDGYTPDTLRIGLDSAHLSIDALVKVMLDRGLIAKADYFAALADAVEAERDEQLSRLGLLVD